MRFTALLITTSVLSAVAILFLMLPPFQNDNEPILHNDDWTPVIQEFDGVEMVKVPPGCFMMGSMSPSQECLETPFWIGRFEVTTAQFNRFVDQAGAKYSIRGQNSQRPVDHVTWYEARDFCAEYGMRLPTNEEWEYAARGPDNLLYTWGNVLDDSSTIWHEGESSHPLDVSWVRAVNMSGGVVEWTTLDNTGQLRMFQYGSSLGERSTAAQKFRVDLDPFYSLADTPSYGFRCAFSDYDPYKWQPRLYSGYTPSPTPTFTRYPTDFCCD